MVDDKIIWDIIAGRIAYCALVVSNQLEIFEFLNERPKKLIELSKEVGIDERPLEALLLMLVNVGLLHLNNNYFKLSDCSEEYLIKSSKAYFGEMLELSNTNWTCEDLKQSCLTNTPHVYSNSDIFDEHSKNLERVKKFTKAMHSASLASARKWPKLIDLSEYKTLLDVGGGSGAHIIGALNEWSHLKAILLDLQSVTSISKDILKTESFFNNIQFVADDFWECAYPDADIHFYSQIFHDWPIEKCQNLAMKSYDTLPDKGIIIIHEILFKDDKSGPYMAAAGNVGMLAWTEGRQYSGFELVELLKLTGFREINVIPTFGYWSIVVGKK